MSNGSKGWRVRCQTCGCTDLYVTTEHYNPNIPLTGDMLELQKPYKDWPTYDGSLAVKSTSRILLFCSKCAGYVSTTGKLKFVDFPDVRVTEISQERSKMPWWDSPVEHGEPINNLDEPRKAKILATTPEDLIKKIEKQTNISRKKRK